MKRFEFSLERMKSYKNRMLDEEKNRLKQVNVVLRNIERAIESLQSDFAQISAELQAAQREGIDACDLHKFNARLENIRLQLEQLEAQRLRAQQAVDRQTERVKAAYQEVAALDKLEERQYEEYRLAQIRAETDRILEQVSNRLARETTA